MSNELQRKKKMKNSQLKNEKEDLIGMHLCGKNIVCFVGKHVKLIMMNKTLVVGVSPMFAERRIEQILVEHHTRIRSLASVMKGTTAWRWRFVIV